MEGSCARTLARFLGDIELPPLTSPRARALGARDGVVAVEVDDETRPGSRQVLYAAPEEGRYRVVNARGDDAFWPLPA